MFRKLSRRFTRSFRFLLSYMYRPWYPFLVGILNFFDVFILAIPCDLFLVSAIFAKPKRWYWIALIALASNMLAGFLFLLICYWDVDSLLNYYDGLFGSDLWQSTRIMVEKYGYIASFFGAMSPVPFQLFMIIGALTKLAPATIFIMVLSGRAIKFGVISYLASHAPHLLQRLPVMRRELEIVESFNGIVAKKTRMKKKPD